MGEVATLERPTRLDQFRLEVLPPERKRDLFSSLPSHVRPERFERNLVNALMTNPELMELDARLVFREVSKAAALGLYLDPQLGEAYLIAGWNGKTKRKEPQLRIGYRGLVKLARQSGEISMVYAHEVHKNDAFKASLGDHKSLTHEPDVFGDRGEVVGYYAVVKYKDGETDFEPLTVAQARAIRDRSDGYRAFADGKIKSTPWSTDEIEMSKKTVIRKLTKRIPQSPELAEAIRIEDAAEHSDMRSLSAPSGPTLVPPSPPAAPALLSPRDPDAPIVDEDVEAVTGEPPFDLSSYFEQLDGAMVLTTDLESLEEAWNESDPEGTFASDPDNLNIAEQMKARHAKRIEALKAAPTPPSPPASDRFPGDEPFKS